MGDIAEVKALKSVFKGDTSHIKMNATKSLIGHCLGAAGGMEAIAVIKVRVCVVLCVHSFTVNCSDAPEVRCTHM